MGSSPQNCPVKSPVPFLDYPLIARFGRVKLIKRPTGRKGSTNANIEHFQTMNTTHTTPETPLRKLFIDQLADMHDAERKLAKAIFLMAKAARSEDLKALLKVHMKETEGHAKTIEQIADSLEEELPKKTCQAMKGLIKEGVELMITNLAHPVLDTALIAAAQKIEHYEIASYGTLCRWAKEMGLTRQLTLLLSILTQEELANELLMGLRAGAAPLKKLVERASLQRAGAMA
jgi:ferritin-like metal-binding protein YciE